MSEEKQTLTIDEFQEGGMYVTAGSTVTYGSQPYSGISFVTSGRVAAGAVASASVDIEGTLYVYSTPSAQWYSIYPQIGVGVDILEDRDVKFEPKQTRSVKGIIVERKRGQFITGFVDDSAD